MRDVTKPAGMRDELMSGTTNTWRPDMFAVRAVMVLSVLWTSFGCNSSPSAPGGADAVFEVAACSGQTFNIRLNDPEMASRAEALVGRAEQPIVNGRLARGNGGFNAPYSWHLIPDTIEFADVTIELCDGCPQMVERDLDYWLTTVGRFCPWSSRIVRRVS